ncbi:NADH-ubiquinone oxidoreductase B12 subunit [Aspergillus uvarum CBS 121591]|uniref:NADH-ubiquinone oxidoreductase B12 subunit n=1 Tax=Aspergillus uvarum CBS 121591 TaxID=1448315 RepID=A0A319CLR0_9EURO|nr:NADH-ubiquinone oxidoreductase B12 subunit [Aspergillus uvarum CBS 121591]PYH86465.1 NADH-ubiquinone oxidoreductase B12 subunit [Aspergillus uvarum CBS 121591]
MARTSPTGFDVNEFKAAAHPRSTWAKKDPWARYEAWRYTGPFSRWNRFRNLFPGLGIATVAFAGYCAYEAVFLKDDHHHGGHHDEKHH